MRARHGILVGWLGVAAFAALLVVAAVDGAGDQDRVDRSTDGAERFVAAWERSRTATFVASGTFERRSEVTGSQIASEDVLAQRPPQRLHRQLGGVEGRDDDRLILCPAAPDGAEGPGCELGAAGGPSYEESVAREVAGLHTIVGGTTPVYSVQVEGDDCFVLDRLRVEPRAPFGQRARFCFDGDTGAPTTRRVEHGGGIVEVLVVTEIRTDVVDADLRP